MINVYLRLGSLFVVVYEIEIGRDAREDGKSL